MHSNLARRDSTIGSPSDFVRADEFGGSMLNRLFAAAAACLAISAPGLGRAEPAAEAAKWDVSNPMTPSHDVSLDLTTGTWLSLSVSPDGKEIVFDLLGDLYVMPITGGEPKALTTGIAWDMQPTYSPNGRWIAFTSDRGGGDNVWVINRDGTNPHQVSKES